MSRNPLDHPLMDPNYLGTEQDIVDMRNTVRKAREIFKQDAFKPFRGQELLPGWLCLDFVEDTESEGTEIKMGV